MDNSTMQQASGSYLKHSRFSGPIASIHIGIDIM